jgi:DNA-binding HxlR family transcriptional regulator
MGEGEVTAAVAAVAVMTCKIIVTCFSVKSSPTLGTMPKIYGQRCPVAKTLEVVGDRWTLLVVRDLLGGARRFRDLQAGLPGLAPNILSERLKLMEEHGLVGRRFYSDHPPRAEYELTDKGGELGVVVGALAAWGARHVERQSRLVHADSGREVRLGYFRADTGERVPGSSVRVKRGSAGTRRRRG